MIRRGLEATKTVEAMVDESNRRYKYWRRHADDGLIRCRPTSGVPEMLVDSCWGVCRRPRHLDDRSTWEPMEPEILRDHAIRYFIDDLAKDGGLHGRTEKLRRSALGRWVIPPPRGGEGLAGGNEEAIWRSQEITIYDLREVYDEDLPQLEAEATVGYERELNRNVTAEQRANYFLVAAGLSTSVILANAGLLIGSDKLKAPWFIPALVTLAAASGFAILSGFRAMEVSVSQFQRIMPASSGAILARRSTHGGARLRAYVAMLLLASDRESVLAQWKFDRLRSARRWFLGMIAAFAVLTALVLAEAL